VNFGRASFFSEEEEEEEEQAREKETARICVSAFVSCFDASIFRCVRRRCAFFVDDDAFDAFRC